MGTVQGGEPPHKRPSENTGGGIPLSEGKTSRADTLINRPLTAIFV